MNRLRICIRASFAIACMGASNFALAAGPDVILSESTSISNHAPIGGIRAYSIGSNTCNIGNANLLWSSNNTPGLAMNAYRLFDGRLEQIGLSWVKTACCAAAGNGCGLGCNGQGGSFLGAGCLDVYDAGWNSGQSQMARRSGINAYSGAFGNADGQTGNSIFKRLQVAETDINPVTFPGALYFFEGVYAGSDDAQNGNWLNNASYKRVTINAGNATYAGSMFAQRPAIFAWKDHGLGPNTSDPAVTINPVDVPNEGRFFLGYKVTDLGGGQWRYDYAVYNLNSDRSGGGLFVPFSPTATVTNTGFHDVSYHSGEPYDNADWSASIGRDRVVWSSPQTFALNQNSNALRWGTMYSFWFTATTAPRNSAVTIGLFKPHVPQSVTANALVPDCALNGDLTVDGLVDGLDISMFVNCMLAPGAPTASCFCADVNDSSNVDQTDADLFVATLLGP